MMRFFCSCQVEQTGGDSRESDSLSAVDMETDLKIRRSLRENVHGTTILIAHRITTLMNADQILVLDKGRVAQLGTHQELAAQEGIYQTIYNMQRS